MKKLMMIVAGCMAMCAAGATLPTRSQQVATLPAKERAEGWRLLWDGKSFDGWVRADGKTPAGEGWEIKDGVLSIVPRRVWAGNGQWKWNPIPGARAKGGMDICTQETFRDFHLKVDFRLPRAANSGIKYFYNPERNAGTTTEYQLLDPAHPAPPNVTEEAFANKRLAALYYFYPAKDAPKYLKPCGEWNTAEVISRGRHVEHWLNGVKVLEYTRGDEKFREAFKLTKWNKPQFAEGGAWGEAPSGRILLQDHDDAVSFRNIKIRILRSQQVATLPAPGGTRAERFANPPGASRLLPIRHNHPLDAKGQDAALAKLVARGFGGFAGNVSFGSITNGTWVGYVDDESRWPAFVHSVEKARSLNMSVWLYDECGYPSGTARDLTLKGRPDLENTGYLIAVTNVCGGQQVSLALPPGVLRCAVAWPLAADGTLVPGGAVDIADAVSKGERRAPPPPFASARTVPYDAAGRPEAGFEDWRTGNPVVSFTWTAPAGSGAWKVFAVTEDWVYEGSHAECKGMKVKFRYPNPLRKDAISRYLEMNHEPYARHLGHDLGRYFASTFTDEPSIMSNWWRNMPYLVLPSAPGLPDAYRARTGRNLLGDIPLLVADGADAAECRIAFWDIAGQMVADAYFGTISDWCRAHGFRSGGHLMGEESFNFHVSHYGDFFRCMRRLDAPSIDCLTSIPSQVPWLAALFAGSARELNGARYAMSETSDHSQRSGRKVPYLVSEDEIAGTLNRLLWGGINTFTSYYGLDRFDDATMRRINTRLGRLNTLFLQDGFSLAEIAVVYPAADMQAAYVPGPNVWHDKGTPIRALQDRFYAGVTSLYEAGRSFLVIDADALEAAQVEGRELVHGKLRWKLVALPAATRLPQAAQAKLDAFRRVGGLVVETGDEATVAARAGKLLRPALSVAGNGPPPIRIAHRQTAEGEVFFVMNDSGKPWSGCVSLRDRRAPLTLWDPAADASAPVPLEADGSARLTLGPWSAVVLSLNP